jgi:hypothetical protein
MDSHVRKIVLFLVIAGLLFGSSTYVFHIDENSEQTQLAQAVVGSPENASSKPEEKLTCPGGDVAVSGVCISKYVTRYVYQSGSTTKEEFCQISDEVVQNICQGATSVLQCATRVDDVVTTLTEARGDLSVPGTPAQGQSCLQGEYRGDLSCFSTDIPNFTASAILAVTAPTEWKCCKEGDTQCKNTYSPTTQAPPSTEEIADKLYELSTAFPASDGKVYDIRDIVARMDAGEDITGTELQAYTEYGDLVQAVQQKTADVQQIAFLDSPQSSTPPPITRVDYTPGFAGNQIPPVTQVDFTPSLSGGQYAGNFNPAVGDTGGGIPSITNAGVGDSFSPVSTSPIYQSLQPQTSFAAQQTGSFGQPNYGGTQPYYGGTAGGVSTAGTGGGGFTGIIDRFFGGGSAPAVNSTGQGIAYQTPQGVVYTNQIIYVERPAATSGGVVVTQPGPQYRNIQDIASEIAYSTPQDLSRVDQFAYTLTRVGGPNVLSQVNPNTVNESFSRIQDLIVEDEAIRALRVAEEAGSRAKNTVFCLPDESSEACLARRAAKAKEVERATFVKELNSRVLPQTAVEHFLAVYDGWISPSPVPQTKETSVLGALAASEQNPLAPYETATDSTSFVWWVVENVADAAKKAVNAVVDTVSDVFTGIIK